MSIQQDINSALGQVGILASLNPSLQQKAQDRTELNKIKKEEDVNFDRLKAVKDEIDKTHKSIEDMKQLSPEERKSKASEFRGLTEKALSQGQELADLRARQDELVRRGYEVSPKKYKDRYFDLRQREVQREIDARVADRAMERAQQEARDKALAKEKRKQYMSNLYKGVNRTLPGFKDMSREQQESIVKKMSPSDRRKTANEEKWRSEIYGK